MQKAKEYLNKFISDKLEQSNSLNKNICNARSNDNIRKLSFLVKNSRSAKMDLVESLHSMIIGHKDLYAFYLLIALCDAGLFDDAKALSSLIIHSYKGLRNAYQLALNIDLKGVIGV